MTRALLVPLLAAATLGCEGGAAAYRQYRDKCQTRCVLPASGCEGRDAGECVDRCAVASEGLPATCAQCVAEVSGYETLGSPGGASTCYVLTGRVATARCAAPCAATPPTVMDPALAQVHCELRCQLRTTWTCPAGTPTEAECAKACATAAQGLPRLCAQCLIEETGWEAVGSGSGPDGGAGTVSCSYSVGRSTSTACRSLCTPDAG